MTKFSKLKIVIIGAGSVNFCPATLSDILLSDMLNSLPLEVCLMDINAKALQVSQKFAQQALEVSGRSANIWATTDLDAALPNADFVITAIEVERENYWSMDFHIPRRYGFRQVYGENGGPGGMFHTLRNLPPMLHIAQRMETLCPDAWLINYTNPEAKLVEAINRLTKIHAVGVCHGYEMGVHQMAHILGMKREEIEAVGYGLNHFGWFTSVTEKATGKDLYPLLREKENECHWLADWDGIGLSRIMMRTYGLYPYPGTNHIGEYIAWSDDYLASTKIQYFFDPVREHPWETKKTPRFVYDFSSNPTGIDIHDKNQSKDEVYEQCFTLKDGKLTGSSEYGIPIIEAIVFDLKRQIPSLNMPNHGTMPGILEGMCVEGPCVIDSEGVHPQPVQELPAAITAMINTQGTIHKLVIEVRKTQRPLFIMIAVSALLTLIYAYGPMFGLVMAFQRFDPAKGFFRSEWVGLDNFRRIFQLPDIWNIVRNTLFIASMKIVLGMLAAITVALLLNELTNRKFKKSVQTIIYAPYFFSWVVLGGIFREMLSRDGLVNQFLGLFGAPATAFLGDAAIFPWILILTDIWQVTGFNAIVYLAAITNIDPTLYEAASIDGAGRFQQALKITIPGIMSYVVLMLILNMGYVLSAGLDQILMLYSPVVYSTGDVIDTWVYRAGIKDAQYSLAAAVGLLRSVVSFALVSLSYIIAKKKFDYDVF